MPAITVTVHVADQQCTVSVDAADGPAAVDQIWGHLAAGHTFDAQGADGSGAVRVRWSRDT
jgi:hypothetical protein